MSLIPPAQLTHPDRNYEGEYVCECHVCHLGFVGHKRQFVCRKCNTEQALSSNPPPNSSESPNSSAPSVQVAGRMERSNADFERACLVHIERLQEGFGDYDSAMMATFCDAVRMVRAYSESMQVNEPAPSDGVKGLVGALEKIKASYSHNTAGYAIADEALAAFKAGQEVNAQVSHGAQMKSAGEIAATDVSLLIAAHCDNFMCAGTVMGRYGHELMYDARRSNIDPCDPKYFNPGFPFRIWRDSGIGYALGRNRPEYSIDGQAKTAEDAVAMARNGGVVVTVNTQISDGHE